MLQSFALIQKQGKSIPLVNLLRCQVHHESCWWNKVLDSFKGF